VISNKDEDLKIQQLLFSDFKYIAYIAYLLDFYNIENDDFHLQILFSVIKFDFYLSFI
jgi:hypothetical protein